MPLVLWADGLGTISETPGDVDAEVTVVGVTNSSATFPVWLEFSKFSC